MSYTTPFPPLLPHVPQSIDQMRLRFPAALEQVFPVAAVEAGAMIAPGLRRVNVFDSVDGRMIISIDDVWMGDLRLHLSYRALFVDHRPGAFFESMKRSMIDWFNAISGWSMVVEDFEVIVGTHAIHLFARKWPGGAA